MKSRSKLLHLWAGFGRDQLVGSLRYRIYEDHLVQESVQGLAVVQEDPAPAQGRQLLIARRLVERGVRFVQVWHDGWDHHDDLEDRITQKAGEIDQPLAALLADLKLRGLLDSTLVIWGGEFGRKPTRDRNGGDSPGRDHNAKAFSLVLAGGGVKGGHIHGATDETGAEAVKDKVHVHDLHATILHLMGIDHEKLTYRFSGRDYRLTDVYGNVVKGVIA